MNAYITRSRYSIVLRICCANRPGPSISTGRKMNAERFFWATNWASVSPLGLRIKVPPPVIFAVFTLNIQVEIVAKIEAQRIRGELIHDTFSLFLTLSLSLSHTHTLSSSLCLSPLGNFWAEMLVCWLWGRWNQFDTTEHLSRGKKLIEKSHSSGKKPKTRLSSVMEWGPPPHKVFVKTISKVWSRSGEKKNRVHPWDGETLNPSLQWVNFLGPPTYFRSAARFGLLFLDRRISFSLRCLIPSCQSSLFFQRKMWSCVFRT